MTGTEGVLLLGLALGMLGGSLLPDWDSVTDWALHVARGWWVLLTIAMVWGLAVILITMWTRP